MNTCSPDHVAMKGVNMRPLLNERAIFCSVGNRLSQHEWYACAGAVCGTAASSTDSQGQHLHLCRHLRCHALCWLQALTSLAMQLQVPAWLDLRAHVMCLEGCSLNHAQPRQCQAVGASERSGRTMLPCKNAMNTAEGLSRRSSPSEHCRLLAL